MRAFFSGVFVLLSACSSTTVDGPSPCERDEPAPFCATPCTTAAECPLGSHCGTEGVCDADCTYQGREMGCAGNEVCDVTGVCVPTDAALGE